MNEAKVSFLKKEFIPLLEKIPFDKNREWGNMTVQQMIEHFADVFRLGTLSTTGRAKEDEVKHTYFLS